MSSFGFLLVSWVFAVIGLVLGIFMSPEMFARMGSVVVLLAVMCEFQLLKKELDSLYRNIKGQGAMQDGGQGISSLKPKEAHQREQLMAHITIVIGTFIWGFGDLALK